MSNDIKLLLLAGIGVAFLAWGVTYSSQVNSLVTTGTTGYGNVIRALEPSSIGSGTIPTSNLSPNA